MSDDPHIVRQGTLPTPFSAEELRAGLPDGTRIVLQVDGPGGGRQVHEFADGDALGVLYRFEGEDSSEERVLWADLQAHAVFDESIATRTDEVIDHPLGILRCLRYQLLTPDDVRTFWFDVTRPGMPVRVDVRVEGERVGGFEAVEWIVGPH